MEKVFANIPTNLTPRAMPALGEQLRGCSNELMGNPFAGTAAEREQTQAIERGFAASEGLILLADALNQGAEITMATS